MATRQLGREFLSLTENMTRTAVVPDLFTEDLGFYHEQLLEIFRNFTSKNRSVKIQCWVDNKQDINSIQKVLSTPCAEDDDLQSWSEKIFGDKKFGMIVTNVETCAPKLSAHLLHVLDPIIQETKIPAGGFDMALFMGNYGWTPLGVHKDFDGGQVIHFHLGPGPKIMYQWEDDIYEKLANNQKNYQFAEHIAEHASKYEFKAGDIYFMNELKWHIGYSGELSVGLAIWFNHFDRHELVDRLNTYIKDRLLIDKKARLDAFIDVKGDDQKIDFPLNTTNRYKAYIEKFYQALYEDYQREMLSNGGFFEPAGKQSEREDLSLTNIIQTVPPFRIQYRSEDDEVMTLFLRAHQVQVPNHPDLPDVINQLNTGKPFEIQTLMAKLLEDWSEDVVFYVVNVMYTHSAIDVTGDTAPVVAQEMQVLSEVK
jgi:hypothetical protein